ncbi:MAG: hypothetical protein NVS3B10_15410 [Polyangiales bacterium]
MKNAYALGCIVALACSGLTLGACSSNDSGSGPGVAADTGGGGTDTGGGGTDTGGGRTDTGGGGSDTSVTDTGGGGGDSSGGGDSGEAGTCGTDPTLHPPVAGEGPYCPGLATDGGASGPCATGQTCCESKKGATPPSSCAANAAACPSTAEATWDCDADSQCPSGSVCCGDGTPTIRTGCTYYNVFPPKGTKCVVGTACGATQYKVCEAPAECTTGTCTPMKTGGKQIGFCKL